MNLIPLTERQGDILRILRAGEVFSSSQIAEKLNVSIPTIKRDLSVLSDGGYISATGKGRTAGYILEREGALFVPTDAHEYCLMEPDNRQAFETYDEGILQAIPNTVFTEGELDALEKATEQFQARAHEISDTIAQRELERFIIELSWKSSRIEGNTYTLLDTERLIREGIEAPGHDKDEATMILNHKKAFDFVYTHTEEFRGVPTQASIEEIHRLLTENLNINSGIRTHTVGVIGTRYRPLDTVYQTREALDTLREVTGRKDMDRYTAAMIALLGVSYIQPFDDGNKRTARLLANAILLARGGVPLSYRNADEVAYREATLVFYETHSLMPFKEIFMTQYLFAAEQYGLRS